MRRILSKRGGHRRRRDAGRRAETHDLSEPVSRTPGVSRLHAEFDRLFDRFFGSESEGRPGWAPSVDVIDSEREYTVRAEMPGFDPEDIEVSLTGNTLVLSGEKKDEHEDKWKGFVRSERRYGAFRKAIPLPAGADPAKVTAEYHRGILTVRLAKSETKKPRQIPVKGESAPEKPSRNGGE